MHHQKKVAVIIVNYNAGALLASHLSRVFESAGDGIDLRVFIVDNQSTDDSYECLAVKVSEPAFSDKVELILADRNGGFAYGNNEGIKAALSSGFQPDYFYMLNPDAYPLPGAIDQLVAVSQQYQDQCLLGSTLHDESLTARCSAFRFPGLISEFQRGAHLGIVDRLFPGAVVAMPPQTSAFECEWVSGAGFFFSYKVFEIIGFMDEDYFLYYEEVDYMRYAYSTEVRIVSVPDSKIVHIAGVSTQIVGGKSQHKPMPEYWYHSWHRFFFKNYHALYAVACGLAWITGRIINNTLALFIKRRKKADGHSVLRFLKFAVLGQRT